MVSNIPSQIAKQLNRAVLIAVSHGNYYQVTSVTELEYLNVLLRNQLLLYVVSHYIMK
jgi:hypothetical protein